MPLFHVGKLDGKGIQRGCHVALFKNERRSQAPAGIFFPGFHDDLQIGHDHLGQDNHGIDIRFPLYEVFPGGGAE
jgi:hypothetical protein